MRIHEILVWMRMRIRGSIPLTLMDPDTDPDTDPDPAISDLQHVNNILLIRYFLKVHFHHFSKIKSHKEVTKQ
jgi:hypothetical protein